VVLERIRGSCAHVGDAGVIPQGQTTIFPVEMAACRVPAAVSRALDSDDLPDIIANLDGDDYFLFQSMICDVTSTNLSSGTLDVIDNKAKRRFELGDGILWLLRVLNPLTVDLDLDFRLNVRILWKHGA